MPSDEPADVQALRAEIARLEDQLWEQQAQLSKVYADLSVRNEALQTAVEKLRERERELSGLNQELEARVQEQLQQLERNSRLRRYLSPEVAKSILAGDAADLKTRKRLVTLLFADIAAFDELMSDLESEELVDVLCDYHKEMTGILFQNGGTLDKFLTARIIGFFGDPVPMEDHAARAVRAGLAMRELVRGARRKWFAGAEAVDLQVGIHTGYVTVGNVGSEHRVEYTAIGKNVAQAAALQQEARPGQVLLSARTYEGVSELFEVEPLSVCLRGAGRSTTVYNAIAERTAVCVPTLLSRAPGRRPAAGGEAGPEMRLGPYVVQERLGAGGMGVVYRALDERLQRTVALKVLPSELAADEVFVSRFKREARALASLNSPYIAQVYYIGDREAPLFFAMEFIDGPTLRRVLSEQGKLPLRRALDLATQIARGLAAAAEQGVIHRDVKPDNVMLTAKGQVKLTDFGLVKKSSGEEGLTSRGAVVGTPLYMSPEQAEGAEVDLRSDIYSLGATLWHMITGAPPFRGDSALAVMRLHFEAPLPALEALAGVMSADVYALLQRMLAKRPADRCADYVSLLAALDAC